MTLVSVSPEITKQNLVAAKLIINKKITDFHGLLHSLILNPKQWLEIIWLTCWCPISMARFQRGNWSEVQHLLCLHRIKHNIAHPFPGKSGFPEDSAAGNKPTGYLSIITFTGEIHHQQFTWRWARFCLQQNPSAEYQCINVSMTLYKVHK